MSEASSHRDQRFSKISRRLAELGGTDAAGRILVTAPLRICPLGAHVDHQGGVVTGLAVDRHVSLMAAPAEDSKIRAASLDFPGEVEIDLSSEVAGRAGDWGDYLRGAVKILATEHRLHRGARMVVSGDLPGSGLSSSAAVLVAYFLALSRINHLGLSRRCVSEMVQNAENSYIGVASGLLDQSIILLARRGSLTRVDCSDLAVEQVTWPRETLDFDVLVAFSGIGRELAGSGFNLRVDECRQAAQQLLRLAGREARENAVLSNVSAGDFAQFAGMIPDVLRRRATHFFEEQQRVREGVDAWRRGDLHRFGGLVTASGSSSIENYQCGTPELVTLSRLLWEAPGVFGARFSGGGFGGSCIALIGQGSGASIIDTVGGRYRDAHPEAAARASFHVCAADDAARLVESEA